MIAARSVCRSRQLSDSKVCAAVAGCEQVGVALWGVQVVVKVAVVVVVAVA